MLLHRRSNEKNQAETEAFLRFEVQARDLSRESLEIIAEEYLEYRK